MKKSPREEAGKKADEPSNQREQIHVPAGLSEAVFTIAARSPFTFTNWKYCKKAEETPWNGKCPHLNHLSLRLSALVYIFDEQPAISPPIASFTIGPSLFNIPGLFWSKRMNSKIPLAPAM